MIIDNAFSTALADELKNRFGFESSLLQYDILIHSTNYVLRDKLLRLIRPSSRFASIDIDKKRLMTVNTNYSLGVFTNDEYSIRTDY